jgi:membrane protease YdiL (CAAX protease family)
LGLDPDGAAGAVSALAAHRQVTSRPVVRWRVGTLGAALAAIVLARQDATTVGLDPIAVGIGFGLALLALAVIAGWRPGGADRRLAGAVVVGTVTGLGLIAVALVDDGRVPVLPGHAAAFAPWVVATVLVGWAEEAVLRGTLFDAVEASLGAAGAVVLTAIAFALIHLPAYGPGILPLDLGVGLALGGLRLLSGGVAAPTAAHVVADLATWWL